MVDMDAIRAGYTFAAPALDLGALVADGKADPQTAIRIPLSLLNRHGLVAGATGTGKTKTLQVIAEQLAELGVPVFLADIKGDVSGMAAPGETNDKITSRMQEMGQQWEPKAYYCEFLTLGGRGVGVPVRATVTGFGPLLLSKVLGLTEVQSSSLNLVFHYADQKGLPLVDLEDLRAVIQHLTSDEGKQELRTIGGLSKQTAGVLLRNLIAFADAGAGDFFGEPEFDIADLIRTTGDGKGVVTLLELPGVVQQPALFSSFLMWMLSELFETLPEVGDPEKPKLVFFFDEAHLLFRDASKPFLEAITQTVRLIRSKGVGVFFVTQTPKDVHPDVLAQLGNRVQHALRAYTPDDAKALKATASTFPKSGYDLEEVLTQLATGEAIVTVLNEKGAPTPVAWTRLRAPRSLMAAIDPNTMAAMAGGSYLNAKYGRKVDRESAQEMLTARMEASVKAEPEPAPERPKKATRQPKPQPGVAEQILNSRTTRSVITAASSQLIRSIFGTRKR
jgi:DNA helicase HerA-like ATPase